MEKGLSTKHLGVVIGSLRATVSKIRGDVPVISDRKQRAVYLLKELKELGFWACSICKHRKGDCLCQRSESGGWESKAEIDYCSDFKHDGS